jgi:hypothetical protein
VAFCQFLARKNHSAPFRVMIQWLLPPAGISCRSLECLVFRRSGESVSSPPIGRICEVGLCRVHPPNANLEMPVCFK